MISEQYNNMGQLIYRITEAYGGYKIDYCNTPIRYIGDTEPPRVVAFFNNKRKAYKVAERARKIHNKIISQERQGHEDFATGDWDEIDREQFQLFVNWQQYNRVVVSVIHHYKRGSNPYEKPQDLETNYFYYLDETLMACRVIQSGITEVHYIQKGIV